jgi:hypothetical protein
MRKPSQSVSAIQYLKQRQIVQRGVEAEIAQHQEVAALVFGVTHR